jgi:predicted  nucleic acid-binding Zn-ribbon protein
MSLKSILRKLFQDEFDELYNQISLNEDAISRLYTEREAANMRALSLRGDVTRLNNEVANLNNNIADLETQKNDLESKFNADRERLFQQVWSEAHQKDQNWQTVLTERENHSREIERLTNDHNVELNAVKADLTQAEEQVQAINQQVSSLLSEKHSAEDKIASLNEANQQQIAELANSISKIEELSTLVRALENDKQLLQEQLDQARQSKSSEEVIAALRSDNEAKAATIKALELDIQTLNENIADINHEKAELSLNVEQQRAECTNLKNTLSDYAQRMDSVNETLRQLDEARQRISDLEYQISILPTPAELVKKNATIEKLQQTIEKQTAEIDKLKVYNTQPDETPIIPSISPEPTNIQSPKEVHTTAKKRKITYKKMVSPYGKIPNRPSPNVIKKNFPIIENDNVYGTSSRLIDEVYNCRTHSLVKAERIFMDGTAEEISRLSFDLLEALRKKEPYLICPHCHQMLRIGSREVGFGPSRHDVQYFAHAVKNLPCELKRDYTSNISVSGEDADTIDTIEGTSYIKEIRTLIADSLQTEISKASGISDVETLSYVSSDVLPIMKRRLTDVLAIFNSQRIVFELVTPNMNATKVHDKDIFYLINNIQVFWIFGLDATDDYHKLSSSLAKDVLFTNKRNVFVFDIEAQEATKQRGELMLKCNWLDQDNDWYYTHEKKWQKRFANFLKPDPF